MSKKYKSTALILGVILAALFGVFWVTSRPNVARGQDDLPPSPEPPDPTLEAYYAQLPDCCNDETPVYVTPFPIELTWNAPPPEVTQAELTATPLLIGQFLAPSDQWTAYNDPTYGFSFDYPDNWFIEIDGNQIYVHNLSPGVAPKNQLDPNRIKIIVWPLKEGLGTYTSLEAYLSDPKRAVPANELLSQKPLEILPNGYQVIQQERTAFMSNGGVLVVYITDGEAVYTITVFSLKSRYLFVVDHIINSLTIP